MSTKRRLTQKGDSGELNISPLIDMVFILLIFFIVTTVFVQEPGVEVQKTFALSSEQLEKNSILIAITEDGGIVYGGNDIGITGVRPLITRLIARDQMPVILQVDQNADAQLVVRVIDEAKLADAASVNIATLKN
jgi:biopolymer transport protein ExbD